jgi:hypothetical protein
MYKAKSKTTDTTHSSGAQPTPNQPVQPLPGQPIFHPQHGRPLPIMPQNVDSLKQLKLRRVKNDSLLKHKP